MARAPPVISVSVIPDLTEFVEAHRPHGPLTADATTPSWNGYLLMVACSCRVVFERWVTLLDAELHLRQIADLN